MMDNLSTVGPYDSSPNLDKECKDMCDKMCKDCTAEEIQEMADYMSRKSSDMRKALAASITAKDFAKMKSKGQIQEDTEQNEVEV